MDANILGSARSAERPSALGIHPNNARVFAPAHLQAPFRNQTAHKPEPAIAPAQQQIIAPLLMAGEEPSMGLGLGLDSKARTVP
jgi:hypothetical protein